MDTTQNLPGQEKAGAVAPGATGGAYVVLRADRVVLGDLYGGVLCSSREEARETARRRNRLLATATLAYSHVVAPVGWSRWCDYAIDPARTPEVETVTEEEARP